MEEGSKREYLEHLNSEAVEKRKNDGSTSQSREKTKTLI